MLVFGKERDYIIHDENFIQGFFGDYRFLSNFELSEVIFEGDKYPSSENAYQAARCADFNQRELFKRCKPYEAKRLSHSVVTRENWRQFKYDIMAQIVFDKFYRNPELRQRLLNTKQKHLVEANHWGMSIGVFVIILVRIN